MEEKSSSERSRSKKPVVSNNHIFFVDLNLHIQSSVKWKTTWTTPLDLD